MAAPSIKSGTGITILESCDNGSSTPVVPSSHTSMSGTSNVTHASQTTGQFSTGIDGTGHYYLGSNAGQYNIWIGDNYDLDVGTFDGTVAKRLVFVHLKNQNVNITDLTASTGIALYANSDHSGDNEAIWPISGGNLRHTDYRPYLINMARSADAAVYDGTFDDTAITNLGVCMKVIANSDFVNVDCYGYIDPPVLINGETGDRGTFADFLTHSDDNKAILYQSPTEGMIYTFMHLHIGDGSTVTWFDNSNIAIEFPANVNISANYARAHKNDNDIGFEINGHASGGGLYALTNATFQGSGYYWHLTGDPAYQDPFTGITVIGSSEVQIADGWEVSGQFIECAPLEVSQPTFASLSITDPTSTGIRFDSTNGLANVGTMTITGAPVAIEVDVAGDCAIDVTDVTFTGSTSYDIQYTGTGTLTVTATTAQAGSLTTNATDVSGTVTVVSPTDTVTVNSNVTALIQIFNGTSTTVLSSNTGTQDTYEHSEETVSIVVQAQGYLPYRQAGISLSGSPTYSITLEPDPAYNASHGLTLTTDFGYNATTRVLTIVAAQEGRDLYSALLDEFRTNSTYHNKPFPIVAVGIDRFDFTSDGTTAATIDAGDIQYWRGAGFTVEHATTGNHTARYCYIKGTGTNASGTKGYYQQVDGASPTSMTLVSNNVAQCIQYYSDTNGDGTADYDYDDHLVIGLFNDGYYQKKANVLTAYDISALEPQEYIVDLGMTETGLGTGDRGITITVTDNTPAGVEEQTGYTFDYKVEGGASDSPSDLLRQWIYDIWTDPTASTYASKVNFNWPDPIVESGGSYSTQRGFVYGQDTTTTYSGFYVEEGAGYHPDFLGQQANDGTYFVTPVVAQANVSGMETTETYVRLQLWNATAVAASARANSTAYSVGDIRTRSTGLGSESTAGLYLRCTTAGTSAASEPTWDTTPGNTTTDGTAAWTTYKVLFYDDDPASATYGTTYTDGEEFASGETVGYRHAYINSTTGAGKVSGTTVATSSGFTIALSPEADTVYASNGIDGQAEDSKFSPNFGSNYIVLDSNADFTAAGAYAYFCYTLTTSQGMWAFWGGVTAIDTGNYRINNDTLDLYFDESGGFVKQTDNARIFRADGARPAIDPTTGGNGIEINWKNPVYIETTGSALTAPQAAELAAAASNSSAIKTKTDNLTFTQAGNVDANIQYVNDQIISGDGSEGSRFSGA